MTAYDIILKPVLTEKSYAGIASKRYVFVVKPDATKSQIKSAIEEIFNVSVAKVNTVSIKGKLKRRGRTQGYTSDIKKAYVTLTEDSKTIEFFDSLS